MLELAPEVLTHLRARTPLAAVTVTAVSASAPRGVGATMAVTAEGEVIGSLSGGCVESDAVALAYAALTTGVAQASRFGFTDADAHAAGLACGGRIDVIAYRIDPDDALTMSVLQDAAADHAVSVGLRTSGPDAGSLITVEDVRTRLRRAEDHDRLADLDDAVAQGSGHMLASAYGETDVLVLSRAPRPRLVILGAGEHAAALCTVGAAAGFAVTVCDAWATLVTPERFPAADTLVIAAPHEYLGTLASEGSSALDARAAICVLTHDERLDIPALQVALTMPVGFVGAMGARSTVARREALLRAAGVSDLDLARLHSPLGLDLGGADPLETAVSMVAEIIASRHQGSGVPLRERNGPVHRPRRGDGDSRDAARPRASCARPQEAP